MDVRFRPIGKRILVRPIEQPKETKTATGIIIPASTEAPKNEGIVVRTGKDVTEVSVGDHIPYGPHAGRDVHVDGVKYLLMREDDADGVYE